MESIGINTTINSNNDATISNNSANIDSTNNGPQANIINNDNNNNQLPAANNIDANLRAEEREDDWLSFLHNFCSFLILFSIVYFYSTLTRFMIVFGVFLLLML